MMKPACTPPVLYNIGLQLAFNGIYTYPIAAYIPSAYVDGYVHYMCLVPDPTVALPARMQTANLD
jgi:hypothetical protein